VGVVGKSSGEMVVVVEVVLVVASLTDEEPKFSSLRVVVVNVGWVLVVPPELRVTEESEPRCASFCRTLVRAGVASEGV
jgi:hypothetical protein